MKTNRLEAFSDGVIAIIITIMVLELKAPHEHTFDALKPLLPVLLAYVAELHLRGHLLEQSPPHVPRGRRRQWRDAVGESASAVLAVAAAVRDGMDG